VDRPFVVADLRSEHLDLTRFRAKPPDDPEATSGTPTPGTAPAAARARAAPGARLLPDDPLPFDRLKPLDGEIRLTAAELVLPWNVSHDVIVAADLKDGALRASRLEGTNPSGGRLTATLSLEPADGGYHLEVAGDIAGGIVDFSQPGQAPEWTPPVDVEFELDGVGASLHALAARSNGHALVTWGAGRVPSNLAGFVTSDVLQNLMDALNPFRKSSSETTFECGVVALTIENGKLVASPIAATTDKIIMLGHGRIDFDTETLDLAWTLKPRTGVGITGSSIANSYVRLGGTLSSPSLETKPLEALASTSAAFLTSGMSLLLRGLYDRITAERKVCVNALKVARDRAEKRERRNRP